MMVQPKLLSINNGIKNSSLTDKSTYLNLF